MDDVIDAAKAPQHALRIGDIDRLVEHFAVVDDDRIRAKHDRVRVSTGN